MTSRPAAQSVRDVASDLGRGGWGTVLALVVAVGLLGVLFPWFPGAQALTEGATVERAILAPRAASYESAVRTREVRAQAAEAVQDVYVLSPEIRDSQLADLDRILAAIDEARSSETLSSSAKETAIRSVAGTDLSQRSATTLAGADGTRWDLLADEARNALGRTLTGSIGASDVTSARSRAASFLSPQLTGDEVLALTELLDPLVVPTLVVDQARTEALRRDAIANAPPVRVTYARGDVIVPPGTTVDAAQLEALEQFDLLGKTVTPASVAATALLAVLVAAALAAHARIGRPRSLRGFRRRALLVLLLLVPAAVAKFAVPLMLPDFDRMYMAQALPLAAGPIVAAVLLDVSTGVVLAVLLAGIAGFVSGYLPALATNGDAAQLDTLRLMLAVGAGSLAGLFTAARADRLQGYLGAGMAAALATAASMLLVLLIDADRAFRDVFWIAGAAAVNGFLTATIAVGVFVLLSRPFGIITRVELMELVQLSHPLLRRLQDEAPGTFQHSVLVGNLAERAADRIGADALLVRVGAYYHDIGKLVAPALFVENFGDGPNPHDALDPLQSSRVIQRHVTAGIDLGRKEGLPEAVIRFIPQHHGTRLVTFFYRRAAELDPDIDPEQFRYPGPRPQSRETALVMLADASEASVRASNDRSNERIRQIVEATIKERIEEGQFDECDLSMRDLRVVADSYASSLQAVFHPRVEYPEPTRRELAARQSGTAATPARRGRAPDVDAPRRPRDSEEENLVRPPERPRRASAAAEPERPAIGEDDT